VLLRWRCAAVLAACGLQDGEGRFRPPSRAWPPRGLPNLLGGADPQRGAIAAVAEAARNLSCVGRRAAGCHRPNLISLHRKHPPATGSWRWPVGGSPRPARPWPRRSPAAMSPSSKRNAPARWRPRQPIQPTPVVGMVVWFTTSPGDGPGLEAGRRHDLAAGRAAGNRPRTTRPYQPPEDATSAPGRAALPRADPWTGHGPPRPAPIWPLVSAACRPCRGEAISQACWPPAHDPATAAWRAAERVLHRLGPWGPELALPESGGLTP